MRTKKIFKLCFIFFLFFPIFSYAQNMSDVTGFVDGQVWYSETPKEGKDVKIYTAFFNNEKELIKTTVDFFDKEILISTKEVSIKPGQTESVFTNWKVSIGSHDIYAKSRNVTLRDVKVIIERNETTHNKFSVTKNISKNLAASVIGGKITETLSTENLKLEKVDSWFEVNFKKSEEFRNSKKIKLKEEKEKVKKDKEDSKDSKASVKLLIFLHFGVISIALFVFSVSPVFYSLAVVLCYLLLRMVWRILKKIFRKKHEE